MTGERADEPTDGDGGPNESDGSEDDGGPPGGNDSDGNPTGDVESPTDDEPSTEYDRPTDDEPTTDPRNTPTMTDTAPESTTDPAATDDTETDPADAGTTGNGVPPDDGDGSRFGRLSSDDLRGLVDRVGLAALVLLALIAGWSFYSQTGRAIRTWLDPAYHPIALALFNLAVLLVALAGVTHQLYRIRGDDGA